MDSAVVAYLLAHTDPTVTGIYRKVTFPSAVEAIDRASRKMLQAAGLEPEDFNEGLPDPARIREVTRAAVLAFAAPTAARQ